VELSTTISTYLKRGITFEEIAKIVSASGIQAIDFPFHSEGFYTPTEQYFKDIKSISLQYNLTFSQTHAPFKTKISNDTELKELIKKTIECIKFSKLLGARIMVVHPLQHLPYQEKANELFDLNMRFFENLIPYAEEYDIKIALENLYQKELGKIIPSVCATPEEYRKYLNAIKSDYVVACFDIGHSFLCKESPEIFIENLGDKLQSVHIHENDGVTDLHTLPYACESLDWSEIILALKSIGYKGDLTLETVGYLEKHDNELLPAATKIMANVGEHLLSKFDNN